MEDFMWVIGLIMFFNFFSWLRKTFSKNTPQSQDAGRMSRRRTRGLDAPELGVPGTLEEQPVSSANRGGTRRGLSMEQFPWLVPENIEENLDSDSKHQSWSKENFFEPTPARAEIRPADLSDAKDLSGCSKDVMASAGYRAQATSAPAAKIEPGLANTADGPTINLTSAGVAGGIIWSEILQPPRCRRPYKRNKK
jgi:hypothetical protein